jgi:hypothetical protein
MTFAQFERQESIRFDQSLDVLSICGATNRHDEVPVQREPQPEGALLLRWQCEAPKSHIGSRRDDDDTFGPQIQRIQ